MSKNVVEINDFRKEKHKRELKEKVKVKLRSGVEWFNRYRTEILTLTPIVIGGVTTVCKVVGKQLHQHKEKDLKELYCYDRSLGHYWRLKRDLSNSEWLEIDRRKKNGERLADILAELKVLK